MRRLMFFASPRVATVVGRRRLRFRFADFLVRMWLLNALRRRTFPAPVTEKRFFAPLWVFIFGMSRSLGSASCALVRPRAPSCDPVQFGTVARTHCGGR